MGWKNLPTWLKGGIIGFVIPIFVLILSYSNPPIWIQGLLMLLAISSESVMITPPKGSAELTGIKEIVSREARHKKLLTPMERPSA